MSVLFDAASFPTLTVEVKFAGVWTDITAYVISGSTFNGRQRELDRYGGSGTLVLDNWDGRFTPKNLAGPYVTAGVSNVRTKIDCRITASWSATSYSVAYLVIDKWQDTFPQEGRDAITTVTLSSPLARLAAFNGAEQASVGGGETTSQRIARIATNAGWTLPTSLAAGTFTVQPTTLAANALTEILLTADSEGGVVWCEPDGTLTFESRTTLIEATRSRVSQATFNDSSIIFRDPIPTLDSDRIATMVSFARAGGIAQAVADATARSRYGDIQSTRTDLICETDTQVAGLAQLELAKRKDEEYRICSGLTMDPHANPSVLWPQALGRRIRDRVTVAVVVARHGLTYTDTAFIEGIGHSFSQNTWETSFTFSSTAAFDSFSSSLWNTGLWDTATWFF